MQDASDSSTLPGPEVLRRPRHAGPGAGESVPPGPDAGPPRLAHALAWFSVSLGLGCVQAALDLRLRGA